MVATDPIADFLTRIRNASRVGHAEVEIPASRIKKMLAGILKREGFISDFRQMPGKQHDTLWIRLRYQANRQPMIREIKRLSRPGCRRYASVEQLRAGIGGITTTVLSTPRGILTDREAIEANVGGELICRLI